jgi:hypothetical protein
MARQAALSLAGKDNLTVISQAPGARNPTAKLQEFRTTILQNTPQLIASHSLLELNQTPKRQS